MNDMPPMRPMEPDAASHHSGEARQVRARERAEAAYLRILALSSVLVVGGIAGLNWLINPFSLFDPPPIKQLNVNKPGYVEHLRLTHAYRVARDKPDCILLGTSRAGRGLRPDHPALSHLRCYNLSLPAISMYEMRRYLQHAQAVEPLELAIVSIDFRVMNAAADRSGAFVEARLAVDAEGNRQFNPFTARVPDMAAALLSLSALQASFDSVRRQDWIKDTLRRDGLWAQIDDRFDHPAAFDAYTRNTVRRFGDLRRGMTVFDENLKHYRLMVREAHVRRLDLHLLIPPSHAWHWQTLWHSALWPQFEDMKRALVSINEEEARRATRAAFPVLDFSGSSGPALESVPLSPAQPMQWFWEPVHFKPALGDRLIAQVMDESGGRTAPAALGTPITSSNIDAHLQRLRRLQEDYAAAHPDVAERVRQLAGTALAAKP